MARRARDGRGFGDHRPGLCDGIDAGLRVGVRSERSAVVEESAQIPVAIPGGGFDGVFQHRCAPAPIGGHARFLASPSTGQTNRLRCKGTRRATRFRRGPSMPTRFMPSFQSPLPNNGRPWEPSRQPWSIARRQCSQSGAVWAETAGTNRRSCSSGFRGSPSRNGDFFVQNSGVACHGDVVRDHERQPQQIVGAERAHAHAGFRMPPMLHVAFDELARGGTQNVGPRNLGPRIDEGQRILQLIAETEGAAGLIERRSVPKSGSSGPGRAASDSTGSRWRERVCGLAARRASNPTTCASTASACST